MKPAPFKYFAASSLDHALSLKAEHGEEARFLAGGQSLIPAMNFRLARPAVLIDINGLNGLAGIEQSETIRVGALTRYCRLERDNDFLSSCPLFADALPHVAHPQIRNRGTIGGNLSHADPASELPTLAVAMEARMRLKSVAPASAESTAAAFFIGALTTDVAPDEMLVDIECRCRSRGAAPAFMEVARRRGDFAIVGVAASLRSTPRTLARKSGSRCAASARRRSTPAKRARSWSANASSEREDRRSRRGVQALIEPAGNVHASRRVSAPYRRRADAARAGDAPIERARVDTDRHEITRHRQRHTLSAQRRSRACC